MYFAEKLKVLLKSNHTFIYIVTNEEERIEYTIQTINKNQINIFYWDFIDGYQNNPNYQGKAQRNPLEALEFIETIKSITPQIFILRDFHLFINDISIIRKIKNLYKILKSSNSHVIILASEVQIPISLQEIIVLMEFPLPNFKEIKQELKRLLQITKIDLINKDIEDFALAYKGLSIERIRKSIYTLAIYNKFHSTEQIITNILEEKKQFIQQTDILDFYPATHSLQEIGGLINLKIWLQKRSNTFSLQAHNYGIPAPKGVLLVGIQGTGKSLSAKAIAKEWKIPLLKLDIGKLFNSLVGESEFRMRQMIKISEASAPCVLWIDEIDKTFNRMNNNNDGGTTNRVVSSFLTWLSEKESSVFVVATANNITYLPPEMLRKGRFDEIFFLDLPNEKERYNIFKIHLRKVRPHTWKNYDITHLSNLTNKFSGAEIEQCIIEAMHQGFYEKREFTTQDIISAITECIPLSFTNEDIINSIQKWVKTGKIRNASHELKGS